MLPQNTKPHMQNLAIQFNGSVVALVISGTKTEREQTHNLLYNHGATDVVEPETLPDGSYVIKTTRYKFAKGVANWQEFRSGLELTSKRAKKFFMRRAQQFVSALPYADVQLHKSQSATTPALLFNPPKKWIPS